eukprot:c21651_g1_i1 orf=336-1379(-)
MNELSSKPMRLKLVILIALFCFYQAAAAGRGLEDRRISKSYGHFYYNQTLARILVEYASAVYINDLDALLSWTCSRCNGLTKGFQIVELIVDVEHCLQAFVGVAEDLGAIVIAFRGTQENSIQNWVENLYFKQLDLNYPGVKGAMVHQGFFSAYYNTSLGKHVVEAVDSINKKRNGLKILVTGHSMGGAMASFCGLDLKVNHGMGDVQVLTFGQPRIGNSIFAAYFSALIPKSYRMTHGHDIVPHLPPYYSLFPQRSYHHFPREVWIYKVAVGSLSYEVERVCDNSGEDPTCSRSVYGNSIADHVSYFGVDLKADAWASCSFVLQKSNLNMIDGLLVMTVSGQDSMQ